MQGHWGSIYTTILSEDIFTNYSRFKIVSLSITARWNQLSFYFPSAEILTWLALNTIPPPPAALAADVVVAHIHKM